MVQSNGAGGDPTLLVCGKGARKIHRAPCLWLFHKGIDIVSEFRLKAIAKHLFLRYFLKMNHGCLRTELRRALPITYRNLQRH